MKILINRHLPVVFTLFFAPLIHATQPSFYSTNGFTTNGGFAINITNPFTINLPQFIHADQGTDTNFLYVSTSFGGFALHMRPDMAPKTVANFLNYVRNGSYGNTFIHRSVADFVLQTGGYTLDYNLAPIQALKPVQSEFGIRNTTGTVAMALVGKDSNSATSQWFINLVDNTSVLDNTNIQTNPPFTVFAEVSASDMTNIVDKIQSKTTNYNLLNNLSFLPWSYAFSEVPLTTNVLNFSSFVKVRVSEIPFFAYSSDPDSFSTELEGSSLKISFKGYPTNNPTSFTVITAGAIDTNGVSTESSFVVVPTTPGKQTIKFPKISDQVYNTNISNSFYLSNFPTSSSQVPVVVSIVSGPVVVATNQAQQTDITSATPLRATNTGIVVFSAKTFTNTAVNYSYHPAAPVNSSLSIKPHGQTISPFTAPFAQVYGNPPLIITPPTSDSGLKVTVTVKSGPAKINNNLVTITGAGTVTLAANQAGSASVAAAPEVTTSFVISKASPTIKFERIPTHHTTDKPFAITLPTSSVKLPVTLAISGPATIKGKTITLQGTTGMVTLTATTAENSNYYSASASQSFIVLDSVVTR